jgi:hypothetical protein
MRVGVMKEKKLTLRDPHASHTGLRGEGNSLCVYYNG